MTEALLRADKRTVHVQWNDGTSADYPFIWLRDNGPEGFHADTKERHFDLLSVPADVAPKTVALNGSALELDWGDSGGVSRFDLDWLKAHQPGCAFNDPAGVAVETWRADLGPSGVPRAHADDVLTSDTALHEWLCATKRYGLSMIEGLADSRDAGTEVARRIGFLRKTNFGTTFEVKSKPNPNNLAYTADRLPLHTDLPNQELPPGYQFLHCLANEAVGGGSLFCDGYAVAADLKRDDPAAYDLLSRISIPFRFHDAEYDIRRRHKVIVLDDTDAVAEIRFNAHIADALDLPADAIEPYYRAYRRFMALTRDPAYLVTLKLAAGEMVVFDNRRVLHGREAFDPNTGYRHLHGCYVDRGEFDSRLRVLSR